jgi:hypothetical protein
MRNRPSKRGFPVLLLGATLAIVGLSSPRPGSANASGCSGMPGSPADFGSAGVYCSGTTSWCYECEYSYPGGRTVCAESGDISYCIDYQD